MLSKRGKSVTIESALPFCIGDYVSRLQVGDSERMRDDNVVEEYGLAVSIIPDEYYMNTFNFNLHFCNLLVYRDRGSSV